MKKGKKKREEGFRLDSPIDPEKINTVNLFTLRNPSLKKVSESEEDRLKFRCSGREAVRKALKGGKSRKRDLGKPIVFRMAATQGR